MRFSSAEQTEAFGRLLGERAPAGTVFTLEGDLGAGKTVLARGIARGLGIGGRIPSPTFILVAEYLTGRLPFHHLDLYRLGTTDELEQLGLDEVLFGEGVCAVEWPQRAPELWSRAVHLELQEKGDDRILRMTGPPALVELFGG